MAKEYFFIGILGNADKSLSDIDLGYGFRIKSKKYDDLLKYIRKISDNFLFDTEEDAKRWLFPGFSYIPLENDTKIFYIVNEDIEKYHIPRKNGSDPLYAGEGNFFYGMKDYQFSYLQPVLRLMRLFKECDIRMISYVDARGGSFSYGPCDRILHPKHNLKISKNEKKELNDFIKNTNIPLPMPYLQLAFENFEISYDMKNLGLSFLMPMISLETLFNVGQQKLSHSISESVAKLLQENRNQHKRIYNDVKNLYKKRSKLVHSGSSKNISNNDIIKARNYARNSIKEIMKLNITKKDLLVYLNLYNG